MTRDTLLGQAFDAVTVLFCELLEQERHARPDREETAELVAERVVSVNHTFSQFDRLLDDHLVYKVFSDKSLVREYRTGKKFNRVSETIEAKYMLGNLQFQGCSLQQKVIIHHSSELYFLKI